MKIVISPAKSLDYTTVVPTGFVTKPRFVNDAKKINEVLKQENPNELINLMKISTSLADLNCRRNQERSFAKDSGKEEDFRPAIFAFNGDVYTGLDAFTLKEGQYACLQEKLRILSGLYGLLRPFDEIEPYRLEMGTKLPIGSAANLYEFWKPILTEALNAEMKEGELLVNLASNEYFSALDKKQLKARLVTPEFKELRNGQLKVISFYAKKARGSMVRFILDHGIEDVEGLKRFNVDGYAFSEADSTKDKIVFTR